MKLGPLGINFGRLGIFILIGLALILVMNFSTRLGELAHLQNQAATVHVQATGVMLTQAALQTQVAQATSSDAVDAYARGDAHLGKPGDKVIIVVPIPGVTPQPTPMPTPPADELSPWEVWMILIFGE
jgi:hypothetical protein